MAADGAATQQVWQQKGCAAAAAVAMLHRDGVAAEGWTAVVAAEGSAAVVAAKDCAAGCGSRWGCTVAMLHRDGAAAEDAAVVAAEGCAAICSRGTALQCGQPRAVLQSVAVNGAMLALCHVPLTPLRPMP